MKYEFYRTKIFVMNNHKIQPTEAELEILNVLWEQGPSTVRTVHEEISKKKDVGYTTTLKIMQNMAIKGLLQRDEDSRSHVYSTSIKKQETQKQLVNRLLDTAFGGSAKQLVMQALGQHKSSKEELEEIKALIKKIEGGAK